MFQKDQVSRDQIKVEFNWPALAATAVEWKKEYKLLERVV